MIRLAASTVAFAVTLAVTQGMAGSTVESAQLAIIQGRVAAQDDAAAAMRGARIALVGTAATADPVFTDGEGRFALGVPDSFTLKITKTGYAPALASGRAAGPSRDVEVRLVRGGVIAGRVADGFGFPVVSAFVRARWLDRPAGLRGLDAEFTAETDDTGEFRIGNLPAGRYTVNTERRPPGMDLLNSLMVLPREALAERERATRAAGLSKPLSDTATVTVNTGQETFLQVLHQERAVTMPDAPIGGAVTGTVVDAFGEPLDSVVVRLWRLRHEDGRQLAEPTPLARRASERGEYRLFHVPPGRYLVVVVPENGQHAPVYYPGVTGIATASPVTVARRQEVPGVHIPVERTRHSRLWGIVRTAAGEPSPAMINLLARGDMIPPPVRTNAGVDGRFEFPDVAPGEYVVQAYGRRVAVPGGGLIASGREDLGVLRVVVAEGDSAPVTVVLMPTATLTGRVVTDDGRPVPSGLRLSAVLAPEYAFAGSRPQVAANIDANGRFEMRGLMGPVRIALTTGWRGYRIKSVDLGASNAAEEPVVFEGEKDSRDDVTVILSSDVATIAGRVTDDGRELNDFRVIVFAVDPARWYTGSPYVQMTAGPGLDGGFVVQDLPPGEYWTAAVDVVEGDAVSGEWQSADFLRGFAGQARRVEVGPRGNVRVDLRLVRRQR